MSAAQMRTLSEEQLLDIARSAMATGATNVLIHRDNVPQDEAARQSTVFVTGISSEKMMTLLNGVLVRAKPHGEASLW